MDFEDLNLPVVKSAKQVIAVMEGISFERDYRAGFDFITKCIHEHFKDQPQYKFEEFIMPNGQIERWWTGDGESLTIRYKDDRHNADKVPLPRD